MLLVAPMIPATFPVTAVKGAAMTPAVQVGDRTACSVIDAEELQRLTGRKDVLKRGPRRGTPPEPAEGRTSCSYLGFIFELDAPAKRGSFDETRSTLTKMGTKTQAVSGVGDGAYYWWDPTPGDTRPVGIMLRVGTSGMMIMDMTSPDSIELLKPQLLAVAKAIVPKLR
jgi:hypothetical protein